LAVKYHVVNVSSGVFAMTSQEINDVFSMEAIIQIVIICILHVITICS